MFVSLVDDTCHDIIHFLCHYLAFVVVFRNETFAANIVILIYWTTGYSRATSGRARVSFTLSRVSIVRWNTTRNRIRIFLAKFWRPPRNKFLIKIIINNKVYNKYKPNRFISQIMRVQKQYKSQWFIVVVYQAAG